MLCLRPVRGVEQQHKRAMAPCLLHVASVRLRGSKCVALQTPQYLLIASAVCSAFGRALSHGQSFMRLYSVHCYGLASSHAL
jgi:hypothetical protein